MDSQISELAALGRLFEEHRLRLALMVRRRIDPKLAQRIDPEEIVNEAFLAAQRKYADYRSQSTTSEYAWLYRLVLDCLSEAWKRETRGRRDLHREVRYPDDASVELAAHLVRSQTSPSGAVARDELIAQVRRTLDALGEKDREILWMRHADKLKHQEAADVLGISLTAATVRYARALERLRTVWQRIHGEVDRP